MGCASYSMCFAGKSAVRFNTRMGKGLGVPGPRKVTGLDMADCQILSDWLACTCARGIDTVKDFSARPWNIAGASVILGVFEANKNHASWLVVRHGTGWTLARCTDAVISDVLKSLPEILALLTQSLITRALIGAASVNGKTSA